MPAPATAELPKMALSVTVSVPLFEMPPAKPFLFPFVMLRLAMAAPVTPELRVNTEKLLEEPPPATVTRFVSVAPLPEVAPAMLVFDGMIRVP